MLFGMLCVVGPVKHVLEVLIDATWRIRLNRPCAVAMRPFVKLFDHLLNKWSNNGSPIFAGLTTVTDRPRDGQTTLLRYSVDKSRPHLRT